MFRLSELGIRLKSAREEKGYTLEEMQRVTKIQKRYLIAMEEGDFSKMPGEFYARAFVKSYSEAVGLDSEMLFDEHSEELPQSKREPADIPPRVNRSKPRTVRRKSRLASFIPTIVLILFLLAIVWGIWLLNQGDSDDAGVPRQDHGSSPVVENTNSVDENDNENNNNDNAATDENEDNAAENNSDNENNNENDENNDEQEQTLSFEDSDGYTYTYELSGTDEFEITMNFSGDSWLRILDSDGSEVHQQTHSDGDEVTFDFTGESEITFDMGSVRTAEILVNDEQLEYEGEETRQYIIIQFNE